MKLIKSLIIPVIAGAMSVASAESTNETPKGWFAAGSHPGEYQMKVDRTVARISSAAVARTDLSTFYRVVPGTRVRFTRFFQNDNVFQGASQESTLFRAFIDVVGDGVTVLDTREVYILVPANQPPPG